MARKVLADVAPNALLLSALQGIGTALGIEEMASVSSTLQSVYREEIANRLQRAYEDFFGELGIEKNEKGFLVTSLPIPEKPMTEIKSGHKLRTKEKRALKLEIKATSLDLFRQHVVSRPSPSLRLIPQRSRPRPSMPAQAFRGGWSLT